MIRPKIAKYGVWLLPPIIGAAAMLAFLLIRDGGGQTLTPPAAVGEQALPGTPVAPEKIQEARDFDGWPLWWLGESFDSLSLANIDELTPSRGFSTSNFVSFVYGACTPRSGGEGCAPPLNIQVDPLCSVPPERIAGVERDDPFDFRGAQALWIGDHLRIWTGDSAIAIFGYPRDRIEAAAAALVPLGNVEVALTDSNLPPPNFESCSQTPVSPLPALVPPTGTP
jgi:hypothetical protein